MAIRKILDEISGRILDNGVYACAFTFDDTGVDPGNYRVRLFFRYDGTNDLTSSTGIGLYAVSDNPCDRISYDDWNGAFRKAFYDTAAKTHDSSFNTEIVCEFSGDTDVHEIQLFNQAGKSVRLAGESLLDGRYGDANLPVNILLERRLGSVPVLSVSYDADSCTVTVETDGPHGLADGDAVTISGFPRTDHSCGINGERFNGTYRISVLSESFFSYRIRFFGDFPDTNYKYENCEQAVCTKWITCEYLVDREVMQGNGEALVVWPGHTFKDGDRITLMDGDTVVAANARIVDPAPNSFVCRSAAIGIMSTITSVAYAPRTPVMDVPANYTDSGSSSQRRGADDTVVDNSSTVTNESTPPFYPIRYASFDLSEPEYGGSTAGSTLEVGDGKFGVITFAQQASVEHTTGTSYKISVKVYGSTEVLTEMCMFEMESSSWSEASDAGSVYAMMSKVPLVAVNIESEPGEGEQTCNYSVTDPFIFEVPSSVSDRWVRTGLPVSLAFVLRGRAGARVNLGLHEEGTPSDDCFKIVLAMSSDSAGDEPISVKVMPSMATPGDTVSVVSDSSATFDSPSGNYRICLDGEEDPNRWVPITGNTSDSLTFTMPEGYVGNVSLVVKVKPSSASWDSDQVKDCTMPIVFDALSIAPRVVKMNERMKPGVIENKVSRSATYNRDFGYTGFREITDENSMIQNLYSCLLTRKGERLFNPDFGTTIEERIFSLRTGGSPNEILKECLGALETYEPRIQLVYEQCNITDMGLNGIYLTLGVIVPGGSVQTINIPFKNRGRLV